jgi:hypothetical protein
MSPETVVTFRRHASGLQRFNARCNTSLRLLGMLNRDRAGALADTVRQAFLPLA